MKKTIIIVSLIVVFVLAGCGEKEIIKKSDKGIVKKPLSETMREDQELKPEPNNTETAPEQVKVQEKIEESSNANDSGNAPIDPDTYKPLIDEPEPDDVNNHEDTFTKDAWVDPDEQRVGLVVHETDYKNEDANEEIEHVKSIITESEQWQQFSQLSNGVFAVPIDKFNMSKDGTDSYFLDYYSEGVYRVEIIVNEPEVGIYLLDDNRNEIATFI